MNVEKDMKDEEEMSETEKLLKQVKDAGTAGFISYAAWEVAFWFISVPVCVVGYKSVTGHWPDLSNQEDITQLGAEAFAFVNFARFAVPLRIGLALGTTPWVQENVVDRFLKKDDDVCEPADGSAPLNEADIIAEANKEMDDAAGGSGVSIWQRARNLVGGNNKDE